MKKILWVVLCCLLVGCQKSIDPKVEEMFSSISADRVEFYYEDHQTIEDTQYYHDLLETKQYTQLMKAMYENQVKFVEVTQNKGEYTFHTYKSVYEGTLSVIEMKAYLDDLSDPSASGQFLYSSNPSLVMNGVHGCTVKKTKDGYEIKFSYRMEYLEKDWHENYFDQYMIKDKDI